MTKIKIMKYADDSYTFVLCSVKVSLSKTPGKNYGLHLGESSKNLLTD